jgi:tetratricopeptide (TPR) repeat protein
VISEFQRSFGEILVNVDQAERRGFVEELLDSEPNHLSDSFRQMLYRQTRGHALCTTELLRGMQERGDLVQDRNGMWIVGPALDWETLPARVEAAIAERIGRLAEPLQALLRVASVEGEEFTAEVAARVLGIDRRAVVQSLSRELDQRHRLVRAQSIERPGSRRVSRYRFRNYLFQKYLYDHLDDVERAYIHEDVGSMLEELFGDQADEIAVHLAWHFQEARIAEKAIHYLCKAGERAAHLSAYQEGITHLSRGLALLKALPDSPERAQQELALHLAFGIVWQGAKGARSSERKEAYTRAYELSQQLNKTTQLCQVLGERVEFLYVGAEYDSAQKLGKEALNVAQEAGDPYLVALGYWYLGFTSFAVGEFTQARDYLEKVYAAYEPQTHHHRFVVLRGKDAGVGALAYDACCQWCLGYPDLALKRSRDSLDLARELKHPFSMADVLCFGSCLFYRLLGDAEAMMEGAEELIKITIDRVPAWLGTGISYRGEALVMMGRLQEGIEEIQKGLASRQTVEAQCYNSGTLGTLASAQAQIGRPEEGLATLIEALTLVKETNERYFEAELYRVKGEIMHQLGDEAEAAASFAEAITVARNQRAKSWELRAGVSLARLWQRQHKNSEALRLLIAIYGWFEEGFDTPDLIGAKRLLEDLS